jgi:hypothetical protein
MSVAQVSHHQPIGVFAALSTGFDTVTRQLWLLILPVGLDLFLWLGPRLRAPGLWAVVGFEIPAGLDADTRLFAQDLQDGIRQAVEGANWFGWLRPTLFGVPGLATGTSETPSGSSPVTWHLADIGSLLAVLAILAAIGVGLGGLFWSLIARQARDGRIDWSAAVGRMNVVWPRLLGLALLIVGLVLAVWVPVMTIVVLLGTSFGLIGALLVTLALSLLMWLMFYVTFGIHGIVLYNRRVLDAVRASVWLGRTHFWKTFGLLAAVVAIQWGMGLIWKLAPVDSWLWLVSIGGNAFVVAGLSMATMLYYMGHVPIPSSTLLE